MANLPTVLSQLLQSVPRLEFEKLAHAHDGARRSDALSRWSQFIALAVGHVGQAVEQDPETMQRWLSEDWPAIRAAAKADNAVIFFGDESNLRSDAHRGTTWGIKGDTPVVAKDRAAFFAQRDLGRLASG